MIGGRRGKWRRKAGICAAVVQGERQRDFRRSGWIEGTGIAAQHAGPLLSLASRGYQDTPARRDPGVMRLLARSFTLTGLGSVTPVVMTTDRAVSVPPLESLSR
jgi:hypothetical protein